MLLGKRYTRIKRDWNAATLKVEFTKSDGSTIKLPRKLNMIAVVSMFHKVKRKTAIKYAEKFNNLLKK